jgi:hypothetical protein
MLGVTRTLLFTVSLSIINSAALLAQRGGAVGARGAPLPSSTAIGAGALSFGPSSTSLSSAPSLASPGFGRGNVPRTGGQYYSAGGNYYRSNLRRPYRALPYAFVATPYYYPFFDWGGDYTGPAAPYQDFGPDPAADAIMQNQAALGDQVQRLTAQVNNLMYGQQQAAPPSPPEPPSVPLTVVLRDGQQLTVQNYAITGNTLWNFTGTGAARKIPLANIDVAASTRATEANGGEFPTLSAAH